MKWSGGGGGGADGIEVGWKGVGRGVGMGVEWGGSEGRTGWRLGCKGVENNYRYRVLANMQAMLQIVMHTSFPGSLTGNTQWYT